MNAVIRAMNTRFRLARQSLALTAILLAISPHAVAAEQRTVTPRAPNDPATPVMQCRADALPEFSTVKLPPKRDRRCLIGLEDALKKRWSLVVDTRHRNAFGRGQLPDAVNMSVSELLANQALSSKPLLVYEQGTVQADAEVLCARLRNHGFNNAQVLSGGYVAWARTRPEVDFLPQAELSAADLIGEVASGTPLVVVLGDGYPEAQFGKHVLRPLDTTPTAVSNAIRSYLRKPVGGAISRVVLIGGRNIADSQWQAWLTDSQVTKPVLFHRAAPAELAQSLGALKALWAKQAQGPAVAKGCSAS